jgi:DNA-binding NarL/FixJ family response regulator
MKQALANPTATVAAKARNRVAIVEDRREIRENWKRLLETFPDFECVCTCASAEDALRLLPAARPDVVLMDIFLPRMTGIECTARLKALLPKTQILILTVVDDDELIFLALEAGADGYLLKHTRPSDLRTALLDVLGGGVPMTSEIARRVVESFRKRAHVRDEFSSLTTREEEVLMLLAAGYSNKEIADRLELSIDTIKSHLKHIYDKMHVRSRTEAVARYIAAKPQTTESESS